MRKTLDPKNLPYAGAIIQAVLFSMAGYEFFPVGWWGAVVGLGVGAVVNYSIALASSRINDIAQKRRGMARLMLVGMFIISPITITLSLKFPASVWTVIAWAVDVDAAIILAGAITGKSLIKDSEPQKPAQPTERPAKSRSAKKSKAEQVACRWGCGKSGSQAAMNAHSPHCSKNPAKQLVDMVNTK